MFMRTLAMVKPDGAAHTEHIVQIIEEHGLRIIGRKTITLSRWVAGEFYIEHTARPFISELVEHMTSGPVTVMVLEGNENAVSLWRAIMGATDPKKAEKSSIRAMFWNGKSVAQNVVHGSDSNESAAREIPFFFAGYELP